MSGASPWKRNSLAERVSEPGRAGSQAPDDGSRSIAARLAEFRAAMGVADAAATRVLAAGLLAALLLIIVEFSPIASVDVASGSCEVIQDSDPELADRCTLSGFERHGGAFILFGLVVGAMAVGASAGRSRPAAMAMVAIGVIVVIWSLAIDLPEAGRTGALGNNFEGATGHKEFGLYLEIIAGGLAVLAGVMRLTAREEPERPPAPARSA